ncbi:dynamin family protein [Paenibacillus sp. NEAU-GSW1]|uniref:dynamin family protein n=1 Tax=Paenibacillus sp. NEAU-GSW1 TaxID=2682486 RepID=UPI0012E18545|nr:dynamin family protein [Paenibacillus sp. NEAU-GSW1]MUT65415.1 dynamin [Paenibacillus sp. NEAU-GSW1]
MVETTLTSMADAIAFAADEMNAAGDALHAKQALELSSKLTEGRLTVAFCGHFSAGKSTLINKLCGAKLLPSSPIPTSANVVSIRGGDKAQATVVRIQNGQSFQAEIPLDQLDDYCKDGEGIASVSIAYPTERLGNHTVLLDTPGIDSTDDAHRMATESALHLADVVFYVMDYNHVQSEINFAFAKQLKDWGKPLYFIVNQIDKHRDRELSFEQYRKSVAEAFQAWHLEPAGIVYLSLRQPDHPYQQYEELLELLAKLAQIRQPLAAYSVDASLRHLLGEHKKLLALRAEPEREKLIAEAGGEEEAARVGDETARLQAEVERLRQEPERVRIEMRRELQALIDNAIVTPAPVRDKAHSFLESRKPGFKAGLLFAGAKTAAEQERRLESFRTDFAGQVNAAIDWHVKDYLRKAGDKVGFGADRLEEQFKALFDWQAEAQWFIDKVNTAAVFGNEYTLVYSRELESQVKGLYRKSAFEIVEALTEYAAAASSAGAEAAQQQLAALGAQAGALSQLAALDERAAAHEARLAAALPPQAPRPALPAPSAAAASAAARSGATAPSSDAAPSAAAAAPRAKAGAAGAALAGRAALAQQRTAAARLERAAELLAPHALLAAAAHAMRDKANRLQNSRFTIALFGAFSAGKSSLANALIGDSALPVSPNPTTAAINRLVPPGDGHEHGTATVVMKSRDAIIEDLRYSLALLGEDASASALPEAAAIMRAIDKLSPDAIHAGGRPHFSFLKAARTGWEQHEKLLGQQITVPQEEYESYVAEESRSCFVSEIELYYDCPLTRQGIVLVDTPGADSVNARHTGVAFNYIKNADAVLFVTYYNHAFSQADRQFLMQLGRVKDQFELDKMFFLVNAADLAADEEELQGVLKHVEQNLLQHGIRNPRLYPVSSLEALDAKLADNEERLQRSGVAAFEQSFLHFVQNDLGKLAVDAAEQEIARSAATVSGWLTSAAGDAASRKRESEQLTERRKQAEEQLQQFMSSAAPAGLTQELNELLYYVVQRIQLRFGEFYNYAFNPSSLQDDGRDLKRMIWTSWLELQRLVGTELSQELQATTLRMERNLNKLLQKQYGTFGEHAESLIAGYKYAKFEPAPLPTLEAVAEWQASSEIDAKWLWSRFKSPRHFFEGEGKSAMRKDMEQFITPALQSWMNVHNESWSATYAKLWSEAAGAAGANLMEDMSSYAEGMQNSLGDNANVEQLKQLHQQLIDIQLSTIE